MKHTEKTEIEKSDPADTDNQSEQRQEKSVFIKTYGCQMNEYDSEKMYSLLSSTHRPVSSAENADVVIVNTCSVREKAEHKLFSLLGRLSQLKEKRPDLVVGVSGCVAQQEGASILSRSKAVDFVIGTHNLSLVPSLVRRADSGAEPTVAIDYREEWEELPDDFTARPRFDPEAELANRTAFFSPVRALVAVQRGCNKMCAFCVVPRTRGPQVSRSPEEILKEIRLKVRAGAREVMLLGQTVNSYGMDLSPRYRFEKLVRAVAEIEGVERIRFTSPHPAEFRKEFINLYKEIPQLCPQIHLPLQSGNDRILSLMNRNYRKKRYMEIVDSVLEARPDIAISTDLIVGFPTETEKEFEETLEVMRAVRYAVCFSFMYSVRPDTAAKDAFSGDQLVEKSVAHRRLQELQALQEEHSLSFNRRFLGKQVSVLIESAKKPGESFRGRIPENTPVEVLLKESTEFREDNEKPASQEIARKDRELVGTVVNSTVVRASPYGLRSVLEEDRGSVEVKSVNLLRASGQKEQRNRTNPL